MPLPKIAKEFLAIKAETTKAILFVDFDGKEYWIPRTLCTLIKHKKGCVLATLAAFKFEEITGIHPEPLEDVFISTGGVPLAQHIDSNTPPLVESERYPLYPAQRELLSKAIKTRYFALNSDTGTGKTLMSLTVAYSRLCAGLIDCVIVFCPASLQHHWRSAVALYFPDMASDVHIFSTQSASFKTSHEKLLNKLKAITANDAQVIIDESQMIKNIEAYRTRRIDKLSKFNYVITATATPIGKTASDLFYQFSVMDRDIIGAKNYMEFSKKFLLFGGQDGDRVVAMQNTAQLSERLAPYIFRLTKDDMREDMPSKHYRRYYYDMCERQKRAQSYIEAFITELQGRHKYLPKEKGYQLTAFLQKIASGFVPSEEELQGIFGNIGSLGEAADNVSRIKHIGYDDGNERIKCLLLEIMPQTGNEQVIIFARYLAEIDAIASAIDNCAILRGGMSNRAIGETCESFKEGNHRVLIISHDMSAGLDFPSINHVVFYSTTYDWLARYQAEDRIYRVNRQGDCYVHDIIAKNSIDERIHQVLKYKQDICQIFDSKTL